MPHLTKANRRSIVRGATRSVSDDLLSEIIRHAHSVEGLRLGLSRKAARLINKELLPGLMETLTSGLSSGLRASRIKETIAAISRFADARLRGVREQMQADLTDFAVTESEWMRRTLEKAVPLNVSFNAPSLSTLETIAQKGVIRGRLLDSWFRDIGRKTARKVEQQIRLGVVEGRSIPNIVRAVRGTAANGFRDGVLQATRRDATAVVQTAVSHVSNATREAVYKSNKERIKSVRYVATLDARTTDICAGLDGQEFKVGKGPRPPMHMRCRSTTIPILEPWNKFGVDPSKVPPATRASMNGQVPARTTYGEWLRDQSRKVQDGVLGKGKAELFRKGGVSIDKFTDANHKPLSLAQVINREGLAGNNLSRLRSIAAQRAAGGIERIRAGAERATQAALASLPPGLRTAVETAGSIAGGIARVGAPIANVGPTVAKTLVRLSGASRATVKRSMFLGVLGDWGGFAASPLLPVLGLVPPGSILVGGLGAIGTTARGILIGSRGIRAATRAVAARLSSPAKLEVARKRAARRLQERAEAAEKKRRDREKAARKKRRAARVRADAEAQRRADEREKARREREQRRRRGT